MKWIKLVRVAPIIVALSAIPLFAQNNAQNTDDEIKALEKELRLLELQKQIEQAKRGKSAQESQRESQEKAEQTQDNKSSLCSGQYANTGCFVGFEVGGIFGKANVTGTIGGNNDSINDKGIYGAIANVIFGYQWYFMEAMGVGVKANIGYGAMIPSFSYATSTRTRTASFSSNPYDALNYGVEVQYLVDFSRTFGIGIGLGFDGMNFFDSNLINEASSDNFTGTRKYPFKGFNAIGFSASLGLRFVVKNNHILGLNYKYRVFKDKTIESESPIVSASSDGNTTTGASKFKITINPTHLLSFSYAYKF